MVYSKRLNKMKWVKLFEGFLNNEKGVNLANTIFDKYRYGIWREYVKKSLEAIDWKEVETKSRIYIYTKGPTIAYSSENKKEFFRHNYLTFVYVKSSKELLWYSGQPILAEIDEKAGFYLSNMKLKEKTKGLRLTPIPRFISFHISDKWEAVISDLFSGRHYVKYCRKIDWNELERNKRIFKKLMQTRS